MSKDAARAYVRSALSLRPLAGLSQDEESGLRGGAAEGRRGLGEMTTLTMRYMRGHFVVTGPDIEPVMFKSRREAKDWCTEHHPGSPIRQVGANSSKRATKSQKLE